MRLFFLITGMLLNEGLYAQYIQKIDSLKYYIPVKEDSEKVVLLYDIAWEYRNSSPDSTIYYARRALSLANELDLKYLQAKAFNFTGIAYHYKGDYVNSFEYLTKALALAKELNDSVQYAHALNTLGRLFMAQGDLLKSYNYFLRAKEIFEKINDQQGLTYSYKSFAELYQDQKNIIKAQEMLENALKIRTEIGDERGAVSIYNDLAELHENINEYDKALHYYSNAKAIAERIGDEVGLAGIYSGIADIYYNQSKYTESHGLAMEAKAIVDLKDNDNLRAKIFLQLGKIFLKLEDFTKAQYYLDQVLALGNKAGDKNIVMQAYYHLHLKAELENDVTEAYKHFQKYFELRKFLDDANKATEIERLEARLEIEKKEKENELLLVEQERNHAEIKQQQVEKIALLLLVFLATGFLINIWITARRRRVANKKLEKQKKRIALQKAEIAKQNEQINIQNLNLQKRNRELIEVNEEKGNLMNIMAHDLKGPFNRIIGLIELSKMSDKTNMADVKKYLEMMKDVSLSGISLIRDLLDVHAFEADRWVIKYSQIDLRTFINKRVRDSKAEIDHKNIQVDLEIEQQNLPFYSDEVFLARIFDNLLSNAIKFSRPESTITIKSYEKEEHLVISIQDYGQGFSREDKSHLYKKFKRLSAQPTGGESSNGLGLAIVKLLVDQLNGEIELKSEKNKGSEFVLKFSMKQYATVGS